MYIELSYDLAVDLEFLVLGRYPIELRNQIASKKSVIYSKLGDDLGRPYIKVGIEKFEVEGRKFTVTFSSDIRMRLRAGVKPLHVMTIEEHK